MAFLNRGDFNIYFEDSGGQNPVLLFSHGFMLDSRMWTSQVDRLSSRFRCIAWDQRGFGRTGAVTEPFSYWDSAQDACALLDHLGVAEAIFVGLSQGGFIGLRAALTVPKKVVGLVLISTQAGTDDEQTKAGFGQLAAEWAANGSANVSAMLASKLLTGDDSDENWHRRWQRMTKQALEWPIRALTDRDDLSPRIHKIAAPALVIHGDADPAIDITRGRAMADLLPDCRATIEIKGAGHAPNIGHPELVGSLIEGFADETRRRATSL